MFGVFEKLFSVSSPLLSGSPIAASSPPAGLDDDALLGLGDTFSESWAPSLDEAPAQSPRAQELDQELESPLECGELALNKKLLRTDYPVLAAVRLRLPPRVPRARVLHGARIVAGEPNASASVSEDTLHFALRVLDLTQQRTPLDVAEIVLARDAVLSVPLDAQGSQELQLELQLRFLLRPTKMFRDERNKKKPEVALALDLWLVLADSTTKPLRSSTVPLRLTFNNNESRKRRASSGRDEGLSASALLSAESPWSTSPSPSLYTSTSTSTSTSKSQSLSQSLSQSQPRAKRARLVSTQESEEALSLSQVRLVTSMSSSGDVAPLPLQSFLRLCYPFGFVQHGVVVVVTVRTGQCSHVALQRDPLTGGCAANIRVLSGEYHYHYVLDDGPSLVDESAPSFTDIETGLRYNVVHVETQSEKVARVWGALEQASASELMDLASCFESSHLVPGSLVVPELVVVGVPRSGKSSLLNSFWRVSNARSRDEEDAPFAVGLPSLVPGSRTHPLHCHGRRLALLTDTWALNSSSDLLGVTSPRRDPNIVPVLLFVHKADASSEETAALKALWASCCGATSASASASRSSRASALVLLIGADTTTARSFGTSFGTKHVWPLPALSAEAGAQEDEEARLVALTLLRVLRRCCEGRTG